jgi:exopolyphosphatase / guanosine-5'-triphosphate,3'-diphosphate pyrophosphatase
MTCNPYAVIDIGSRSIRMNIATVEPGKSWKIIDFAEMPIALGRDTFVFGEIRSENMQKVLDVFGYFREMLLSYQIKDENVRIIATSSVREARNRDTFIDRIYIKTGFRIKIIEGIEANHLTYDAVMFALKEDQISLTNKNSMILDVGGGTTEVMILEKGKMVAAHTHSLGTVRLEQQVQNTPETSYQISHLISEALHSSRILLDTEFPLERIDFFVATGSLAMKTAEIIGKRNTKNCLSFTTQELKDFMQILEPLTVEEMVRKYQLNYETAESLLPALQVYMFFLSQTSAVELLVPQAMQSDGFFCQIAMGTETRVHEEFYNQVIASAQSLSKKYNGEDNHARRTAMIALRLYELLRDEHGMGERCKLLLEVASILHDIGKFINSSGHHKHGQYIIQNSEIFGLSPDETAVVALTVRYHRKALPNRNHPDYIALDLEERLLVSKLASLLRIADALEKGHIKRPEQIETVIEQNQLVIKCAKMGDMDLERFSLASKKNLFEETFGLKVVLTH